MNYYKKYISLCFLFFLFLMSACASKTEEVKNANVIKIGLIKEGVGHTPKDAVNFSEDNPITIGPNDNEFAAAVCDYYEDDKKIVDGITWSTINKAGGEIPRKLHIHKHTDSYIVLVNLDYAEDKEVKLLVQVHKNNELMSEREITINKRLSPIKKTIDAYQGDEPFQATKKTEQNVLLEINPNTSTKNSIEFQFVIEGWANTENVSWSFERKDGVETIPKGIIAQKSTPPKTGYYSITINPGTYNYYAPLILLVILNKEQLHLTREVLIQPKNSN